MTILVRLCGLLLLIVLAIPFSAESSSNQPVPVRADFLHTLTKVANVPASGDLEAIRRRGYLRVLVVPNKTHYLVDRGRQFGLAFDIVRDFETALNKDFPRRQKKYLPVVFIPVHRDEVFSRLQENRGDIAVANLTVTPEREAVADFSVPFIDGVKEILVSAPNVPNIERVEDLAGKSVHVRKSSSYYAHLQKVNADLVARKLKPIRVVEADEFLEAEDLMEMLNVGLIEFSVVDQHIGEVWAQIFASIKLHPDIVFASEQKIAWAIRKSTPQLKAAVNEYVGSHHVNTAAGGALFRRYLKNIKWAKGATNPSELARFNRTIDYFRKYADKYAFDPLMLAAQGFQESGLEQNAKSRVGAVGIMQLLPSTGKSLRVGDIYREEPNIHGGTKYMRQLIDLYFNDPAIDDFNRMLFAFAAYNAGPQRIQNLRKEAARRNLNPNVWFNNVETIGAIKIGRETLQYVANISKYYVAYRLIAEQKRNPLMSEKD